MILYAADAWRAPPPGCLERPPRAADEGRSSPRLGLPTRRRHPSRGARWRREVWAAGRLRQRCRRAAPSCSESSPRARPLAPDLSADRAPPDGSARHSHGGDGRRDRFRRPAELHEGPPRLPALRPRQVLRPARARRPHASARARRPLSRRAGSSRTAARTAPSSSSRSARTASRAARRRRSTASSR
mgnify:CR=1 FL=1